MDGGVVREDFDGVGVFVAEEEFELAVLVGLKAGGAAEDAAELHVLGGCEGFEYGPLLEELHLDELYAGEDFERGWEAVVADVGDGGGELVDDELHPEFGDLMLDDEEHLVVMWGLGERALLGEESVE